MVDERGGVGRKENRGALGVNDWTVRWARNRHLKEYNLTIDRIDCVCFVCFFFHFRLESFFFLFAMADSATMQSLYTVYILQCI